MEISSKKEKVRLFIVTVKTCDIRKKNAAKKNERKPTNITNLPDTVDLLFFNHYTPKRPAGIWQSQGS